MIPVTCGSYYSRTHLPPAARASFFLVDVKRATTQYKAWCDGEDDSQRALGSVFHLLDRLQMLDPDEQTVSIVLGKLAYPASKKQVGIHFTRLEVQCGFAGEVQLLLRFPGTENTRKCDILIALWCTAAVGVHCLPIDRIPTVQCK